VPLGQLLKSPVYRFFVSRRNEIVYFSHGAVPAFSSCVVTHVKHQGFQEVLLCPVPEAVSSFLGAPFGGGYYNLGEDVRVKRRADLVQVVFLVRLPHPDQVKHLYGVPHSFQVLSHNSV